MIYSPDPTGHNTCHFGYPDHGRNFQSPDELHKLIPGNELVASRSKVRQKSWRLCHPLHTGPRRLYHQQAVDWRICHRGPYHQLINSLLHCHKLLFSPQPSYSSGFYRRTSYIGSGCNRGLARRLAVHVFTLQPKDPHKFWKLCDI